MNKSSGRKTRIVKALKYKPVEYRYVKVEQNFSDIEDQFNFTNGFVEESKVLADESQMEGLEDRLDYERLILDIVHSLEGDQRLVFLFQIFRDLGYTLDHVSCARAIGVDKRKYFYELEAVRSRIFLIMAGKKIRESQPGSVKDKISYE